MIFLASFSLISLCQGTGFRLTGFRVVVDIMFAAMPYKRATFLFQDFDQLPLLHAISISPTLLMPGNSSSVKV
jgi:hypothetical protein